MYFYYLSIVNITHFITLHFVFANLTIENAISYVTTLFYVMNTLFTEYLFSKLIFNWFDFRYEHVYYKVFIFLLPAGWLISASNVWNEYYLIPKLLHVLTAMNYVI